MLACLLAGQQHLLQRCVRSQLQRFRKVDNGIFGSIGLTVWSVGEAAVGHEDGVISSAGGSSRGSNVLVNFAIRAYLGGLVQISSRCGLCQMKKTLIDCNRKQKVQQQIVITWIS